MDYVDLHTHSNASDGTCSPAEVVIRAADKGLRAIALTDHDTVSGIDEAIQAAATMYCRCRSSPARNFLSHTRSRTFISLVCSLTITIKPSRT